MHREEWTGGLSLARVGQPFFTHRPSAATRPRPAQSVHLPCQPTTVLAGPGIVCCGRVCVAGRGVRPLDQFLRRVLLALQNVACRCRHAIRPSPRGRGNEGGSEEGREGTFLSLSFFRSFDRSFSEPPLSSFSTYPFARSPLHLDISHPRRRAEEAEGRRGTDGGRARGRRCTTARRLLAFRT